MPWQATWHDDDQHVLHVRAINPWSWDDFKAFTSGMQDMIAEKPHKVHVIIDAEGDLKLPKPSMATDEWLPPFMPIREVFLAAPENHGLLILVASPLYVENIVKTVQHLVREQMKTDFVFFAESLADAERILAEEADNL